MRCMGCGKVNLDRFERSALMCWYCMDLKEAIEVRIQKLQTSAPIIYWPDPLRVLSPGLADHIRMHG